MEDVEIPEENLLPNVSGLKVLYTSDAIIESTCCLGTIWVSK